MDKRLNGLTVNSTHNHYNHLEKKCLSANLKDVNLDILISCSALIINNYI